MRSDEVPVNSEQARFALGSRIPCPKCTALGNEKCKVCGGTGQVVKPLGRTYMWAVKKAMGIEGRFLYVSDVKKFIRDNPNFNSKKQTGEKKLLREILDYLKNPRSSNKRELITRLESVIA